MRGWEVRFSGEKGEEGEEVESDGEMEGEIERCIF